MAEPQSTDIPPTFAASAAANRSVADDMAAIFGPELRGGAATPAPGVQRSRRSGLAIAASVTGGVAAVIGAGLLAGGSVVGLPASASVETRPTAMRRAVVAPPSFAVTGPDIPIAAPTPTSTTLPPPPAPIAPPIVIPPERPAISRAVARPSPASAQPVASAQPGCEGDDACLDGQLDAAERDIADAYAEATDAGVRARILRGYRDEWLRARDEAAGRPREALRLYAMMTSDLRNLSEDATAPRRPDWR